MLHGEGGVFCAGPTSRRSATRPGTRSIRRAGETARWGRRGCALSKPVIAAVSGHAVAGGLELALLVDLRVVEGDAVFGVFCRRWGVPLIDGGTVRLPRLIGMGRALDLILTGRPVGADEALAIGLANRLVAAGEALAAAQALARELAAFPQTLPAARPAVGARAGGASTSGEALANELEHGLRSLAEGPGRPRPLPRRRRPPRRLQQLAAAWSRNRPYTWISRPPSRCIDYFCCRPRSYDQARWLSSAFTDL